MNAGDQKELGEQLKIASSLIGETVRSVEVSEYDIILHFNSRVSARFWPTNTETVRIERTIKP